MCPGFGNESKIYINNEQFPPSVYVLAEDTNPCAGVQGARQHALLPLVRGGAGDQPPPPHRRPLCGGLPQGELPGQVTPHCTAGDEGAVADISCMSIFSACFGLLTSLQLAATT